MNGGLLFAFEGVDGAGKTTQARRFCALLESRGRKTLLTKEPTSGPFGQRIRAQIASGEPATPEQELHWFVEDRREHVSSVIEPALASGTIVVCDRYYLSTVAYQGARGLDPQRILEDSEAKFVVPEIAFWLDLDPNEGLARVHRRGAGVDPVFERLDRLAEAARIFRSLERPYVVRIDAEPPIDEVAGRIAAELERRVGLE